MARRAKAEVLKTVSKINRRRKRRIAKGIKNPVGRPRKRRGPGRPRKMGMASTKRRHGNAGKAKSAAHRAAIGAAMRRAWKRRRSGKKLASGIRKYSKRPIRKMR